MVKKVCVTLVVGLLCHVAMAGNKIKYYFNHPVDNTVSTGVNAVYLNSCMADTLVAYIGRAKYSIDIAQYDYTSGSIANIAAAVNSAYSRGVKVRWIYDGSSSNSGLSTLNSAIHTLGSPTSSSYGIMHNKFVIFDAGSSDPSDPIVWTGSPDWSSSEFSTDFNNAVVLQDAALAQAYTAEFNMMWGGTDVAPNTSASKFGPHKTDLGQHSFTIEGNQVELYFSPSDHTDSHIQSTIATANTDLYFGMYTFTESTDASLIVSKYTSGVYVAGIDDSYSNSYTPHSTFTSGLGSHFIVYSGAGIYHNKFMIVDPSNKCSDPMVLTGSHNWTTSADQDNDENTLIIHNDTAANIYYQSFKANFTSLGGSLAAVSGCAAAVPNVLAASGISIFPNPARNSVNITYTLAQPQHVSVSISNVVGQQVAVIAGNEQQSAGAHSLQYSFATSGIYFVRFTVGSETVTKLVAITE